jgi:glycosyltransferase involved in cell wall biosynthesis
MLAPAHSPKISVCIATYNGNQYIRQQLDSILSQLSSSDEVIICDDCSSDNTVSIIRSINDPRIQIYLNTVNIGYAKNFQKCLQKCSGQYIFLADQDDVWLSSKVQICLELLSTHIFVVSDCTVVDHSLTLLHASHAQLTGAKRGFIRNLLRSRYVGACFAFRRSFLDLVLPFPRISSLCPHDYWLILVAEYLQLVHFHPSPLIFYRRHSSNTSNGGISSARPLHLTISQRVYSLFHLLLRFHKTIFPPFVR